MSLAIIINKLLFRTFLSSKAEEMILQLIVKNQVNNNLEGIAHNIAFYELQFLHTSCFRKVKISY